MSALKLQSKIQSEITSLDNSEILFIHKSITCYAVREIERYPALAEEVKLIGSAAFKKQGYADTAEAPKKINPNSYRIIVWDNNTQEIISSYKVSLVNKTVAKLGWNYLSISSLFGNLDTILEKHNNTVLLESSFVSINHQKKGLALILALRGVNTFLAQHVGNCHILGMTSLPYQNYSELAINLYVSCLRHSTYYHGKDYNILPFMPCNESQFLSSISRNLFQASKVTRDFEEIEYFIQEETKTDFKIPTLLSNYTKHFSSQILQFGYDHQVKSIDAVQLSPYSTDGQYKILQ